MLAASLLLSRIDSAGRVVLTGAKLGIASPWEGKSLTDSILSMELTPWQS